MKALVVTSIVCDVPITGLCRQVMPSVLADVLRIAPLSVFPALSLAFLRFLNGDTLG